MLFEHPDETDPYQTVLIWFCRRLRRPSYVLVVGEQSCGSLGIFNLAQYCGAKGQELRSRKSSPDSRRSWSSVGCPLRKFDLLIASPDTGGSTGVMKRNCSRVSTSTASRRAWSNVQRAPGPDSVATTIVDAAFSGWAMRHTPEGEASLLRKTFGRNGVHAGARARVLASSGRIVEPTRRRPP